MRSMDIRELERHGILFSDGVIARYRPSHEAMQNRYEERSIEEVVNEGEDLMHFSSHDLTGDNKVTSLPYKIRAE